MDVYDTNKEVKILIIERKLEGWKNGVYDAQLDIKVANLTDNKTLLEIATKNLKDNIKVCDMLQEELDALKEVKEVEEVAVVEEAEITTE